MFGSEYGVDNNKLWTLKSDALTCESVNDESGCDDFDWTSHNATNSIIAPDTTVFTNEKFCKNITFVDSDSKTRRCTLLKSTDTKCTADENLSCLSNTSTEFGDLQKAITGCADSWTEDPNKECKVTSDYKNAATQICKEYAKDDDKRINATDIAVTDDEFNNVTCLLLSGALSAWETWVEDGETCKEANDCSQVDWSIGNWTSIDGTASGDETDTSKWCENAMVFTPCVIFPPPCGVYMTRCIDDEGSKCKRDDSPIPKTDCELVLKEVGDIKNQYDNCTYANVEEGKSCRVKKHYDANDLFACEVITGTDPWNAADVNVGKESSDTKCALMGYWYGSTVRPRKNAWTANDSGTCVEVETCDQVSFADGEDILNYFDESLICDKIGHPGGADGEVICWFRQGHSDTTCSSSLGMIMGSVMLGISMLF